MFRQLPHPMQLVEQGYDEDNQEHDEHHFQ
jgi:hypothetical protein